MKNIKILLDAAHGTNIAGKRSPDSSHIEYIWSRKMIKQIEVMLHTAGYEVVNLIPEDIDPKDHLKRIDINTTQARTLLISFHNNAAGCGKWMNARGYSVWTSRGQTNSDKFATILFNKFRSRLPNVPFRTDMSDGDVDWEEGFNVLVRKPMAVLIEWLFQDNKDDVKLLQDNEINNQFCNAVVEAINDFDNTYNK
jgi:N-acetylmuramoyl-L-alanine amidase